MTLPNLQSTAPSAINQSNSTTDQPFQIDINKIYTDIIQEIDAIRSFVNISKNQSILNKLDPKNPAANIAKLSTALTVETTPQESRCHAFFRLIGFPVVNKNKSSIYNPGFNIDKTNLEINTSISTFPIPGFNDLSVKRETYINEFLKIFSNNTSVNASVLALSTVNIRNIADTLKNAAADPFDVDINDQLNSINTGGLIGNNQVELTSYIDANGDTPELSFQRFHIIAPFIVDPRINFSVQPSSNLVAVPFQYDKSQLLIGENTYVKRPLIEKVIRDRFTAQDASTLGTAFASAQNYINKVPTVTDSKIISQMVNNVYQLSDDTQLAKYVNIISAMVKELITAQQNIKSLQNQYYWLPIPSTIGPEGGCNVRDIIVSKSLTKNFITDADQSLILQTLKVISQQINIEVANLSGVPDPGGFISPTINSLDNKTTEGFGNNTLNQLNDLNSARNSVMEDNGKYLRTIEIIMGEFSGLGLCDIIIIMAALYLMPPNSLLGFLDEDALTRATNLNVITIADMPNDFEKSMGDFVSTANVFYNLMGKIYEDASQNNNQSG